MPPVPKFNRETRLNGATTPYEHYNLTADTFGASIAQSTSNLGRGMAALSHAAQNLHNTIEDAKLMELSNSIDQWEQENLYDKDNGYYFKNGKDAVGKSAEVLKNYDDFIEKYKSQNRVSPEAQRRMNSIIERKKTRISYGVNTHDVQQTNNWAKIEGQKVIDNAIVGMVHARNNENEMQVQLLNGLRAVE